MSSSAHDVYLDTLDRMEKDIHMVDTGAALASIAISTKRIADTLETLVNTDSEKLCDFIEAVVKGLKIRDID